MSANITCSICEQAEDASEMKRDAFTGKPVCTKCDEIYANVVRTTPLTMEAMKSFILDAFTTDDDYGSDTQSRATDQLAEMLLAQQQRIEALEQSVADLRATEK